MCKISMMEGQDPSGSEGAQETVREEVSGDLEQINKLTLIRTVIPASPDLNRDA